MVVSVLTLQIMVVSLLVLKRGLEPQWFRITAFYGFFYGFLRLYYGGFYGRFFESEFGFESLAFETSSGSSLSPVVSTYGFLRVFTVFYGFITGFLRAFFRI